jgi:hypothetical protein
MIERRQLERRLKAFVERGEAHQAGDNGGSNQ